MAITIAHSYLVPFGKGSKTTPSIDGIQVSLKGGFLGLLDGIYSNSDKECDIEFSFKPQPDGTQQNDCRDLVVAYITNQTLATGRALAERLFHHTDKRSGLGLLFLIYGTEGRRHKLIVSRFPTDSAIFADQQGGKFNLEYLERVFMKSKTSYKAAAFEDSSTRAGFWRGKAVDRQITGDASQYWISDFLASNFLLTPESGTRRFAMALHNAADTADRVSIKNEIASAVTLGSKLGPGATSIQEFADRFNLSPETVEAIKAQLPYADAMTEKFNFVADEFNKHVGYRFVELDTGAMLSATAAKFDQLFEQEQVSTKRTKFSTVGQVINERVGSSKARARTGGGVRKKTKDDAGTARG